MSAVGTAPKVIEEATHRSFHLSVPDARLSLNSFTSPSIADAFMVSAIGTASVNNDWDCASSRFTPSPATRMTYERFMSDALGFLGSAFGNHAEEGPLAARPKARRRTGTLSRTPTTTPTFTGADRKKEIGHSTHCGPLRLSQTGAFTRETERERA